LYKNILLFPTRYFPSISGAEFYFQRIGEVLVKQKLKNIDIITSEAIDFRALRSEKGKKISSNSKFYNEVNNLKISRLSIDYNLSLEEKVKKLKKILDLYNLNLSGKSLLKFVKNGPYLENFPKILSSLMQKKFDIIHTTYFPYLNLIYSLIVAKKMGIPSICTPFFHFSNPRYSDPNLIEVLNKFDFLIACTEREKKCLLSKSTLSSNNIKIIPMGVDYKKFKEIHQEKYNNYSFKKKFFRKEEEDFKMVLFCGYKNYEKGAISVLKSIPYIHQKFKNVYFVFIGPPTMPFNLELANNKKIEKDFVINFTPDNLSGYFDKIKLTAFKESDVYLMPSRSDAFGIAYLEAWASGKPVIGANQGATPEVIKDGENGLLVEFDNPKDIAEKVIKLLKNKHLRDQYGKKGEKKVKRSLTWKIVAQKTNRFYNEIIKKEE
jgi:glycosyltransferase involved in cell wall biosynthesis